MQSFVKAIYPSVCVNCGTEVDSDGGLCGPCWRDTHFVTGHVCDKCGVALVGDADGQADVCDDCLSIARPWSRGRTALAYRDNGRRIVLSLKHADRPEIAGPAAKWIAHATRDILEPDLCIVPIPSHWTRMFRRRYNQAAELARALHKETGLSIAANALIRIRGGETQEGKNFDQRFANVAQTIQPHPRKSNAIKGARILLVDDVMTSGATLAAGTEALFVAGAQEVNVVTLARVARDT